MKKMNAIKKTCVIIGIAVTAFQCKDWLGSFTQIDVENKSSFVISVYIPLVGDDITGYPDTTLMMSREKIGYTTEPNKKAVRPGIGNISLEKWIAQFPRDTASIYIFNQDTLNAYPWEEIQRDYKILQRYDLSLENFHELENEYGIPVITYPPDARMRHVKMYPPYGR